MRIITRVCDRCKKDILELDDPRSDEYHIYQQFKDYYCINIKTPEENEEENGYRLDLCRDCRESFNSWLNEEVNKK